MKASIMSILRSIPLVLGLLVLAGVVALPASAQSTYGYYGSYPYGAYGTSYGYGPYGTTPPNSSSYYTNSSPYSAASYYSSAYPYSASSYNSYDSNSHLGTDFYSAYLYSSSYYNNSNPYSSSYEGASYPYSTYPYGSYVGYGYGYGTDSSYCFPC
jgi:hypothetical protein